MAKTKMARFSRSMTVNLKKKLNSMKEMYKGLFLKPNEVCMVANPNKLAVIRLCH